MTLLLKTCEISKHEFLERIEIAAVVGAPALYDKLPPARRLADDRKKAIDEMIAQARDANWKKPFTDAQMKEIREKVEVELEEI